LKSIWLHRAENPEKIDRAFPKVIGKMMPSLTPNKRGYMLIDITLKITPATMRAAQSLEQKALAGHLGTHFDVMDKDFPLEFVERRGVVFDVSALGRGEIGLGNIDARLIGRDYFVAFCSGFIEAVGYWNREYFSDHPQLSNELIDFLLEAGISIIGVDFAGIRRGKEHTAKDQYCADKGVFVVENLCNLKTLLDGKPFREFTANTYPLNYAGMTGIPCRVVARLD